MAVQICGSAQRSTEPEASHPNYTAWALSVAFDSREHHGQYYLHVDEEADDARANVWSARDVGEGR